ncbi:hypothetical protein LIER_04519 [Lithospermum erythrorhizon]|uniref:Uncharacterized protein n=1 Tax=Lithospermum erythrorhizon TaxID=34254 RepID=A0AAV3NX72_LITER
MNPNGDDNHPHEDDAFNLNNPAAQRTEDAPPNAHRPIGVGFGRTVHEGGSSHSPKMAGLIQGLTDQIVSSVMDQLRDQLSQLRGETHVVSSFLREETYTYTSGPDAQRASTRAT